MKKLMKGTIWAKQQFEVGSRPTRERMLDWILTDQIPGKILGGEPYVEAEQFQLSGPTNDPIIHMGKRKLTASDLLS